MCFPFVLRKIENSVEVSKSMVNFALFERAVQELSNEQKIFEKALVVAGLGHFSRGVASQVIAGGCSAGHWWS